MISLPNKAIIYDDQCPACKLYTTGFVKWGLLEQNNRIPFTKIIDSDKVSQLDLQHSRHHIPLIDLTGGETLYGLDALVFLLSQKIPFLKTLLRIKPIYSFFSGFYNIISYNRRIIIPVHTPASGFDCAPDFSLRYRLYFIALAVSIASVITYAFGDSLSHFSLSGIGGMDMLCIAGTGWVLQILMALCVTLPFQPRQRINYIAHLGVIMIMGVFILLPGICLSALTAYQYPLIPTISVVISSSIMLWQHISRVRHIQLSQGWTIGWFLILQITAAFWLYFLT
ncbi:hypothetical protein GXP67_26380 [Rhodocytophaga rosea]|uniref:DUF393 domain-containing protein n=1 Tax=Rhodocytophaga rosea TaxID=2704465 RepID=A0A6C0GQY8_9BACT|nr:hypothetical protein [Rhodocytophaga rosea]QHT69920.1 hypothetical protein GXP67_26380 [Rhodocytophaga rosea]